MNRYLYTLRIYPIICEDDSLSWGAEFVEIKGCVGGGDTVNEAISELYKNLEDYLKYLKDNNEFIPIPNILRKAHA